jgi:hypothetical protein
VYPVHYFCDNKKGVCNWNAYAVYIYHGVWYQVKPDQSTGEPVLGEPALAVQYMHMTLRVKLSEVRQAVMINKG